MNGSKPLILSPKRMAVRNLFGFQASRQLAFGLMGVLLGVTAVSPGVAAASESKATLQLRDGWAIQSSAKVPAKGEELSRPGFSTQGWYPASVPTTVVAALVKNQVYPDPDFGMNLRSIPGTTYKIGDNFSNIDMPKDSPFAVSWWYRTEFELPANWAGKTVWLNFHGINYRANIWLNGHPVAGSEEVAGAYRRYEFDVSKFAEAGKTNALAVEVFAPATRDLAITFVDWNPMPPDKDMGIWNKVYLTASGAVAIRNPQVITKLDLPRLEVAHLTVSAELRNTSSQAVSGTLRGAIGDGKQFAKSVSVGPNETKLMTFTPNEFPQLNISNPPLWWPYRWGAQNLEELHLEFDVSEEVSDRQMLRFGIDEISSEFTPEGYRLFKVNGRRILIRGGGWTPDMMLRDTAPRWEEDFRYVKDMGLNTVRLEGKLADDEFFDLADQYGILVMAGWCCCDHWEHWGKWKSDDHNVATLSLRDQATRLRNHPSVLVWLYGSDNHPPADVERKYLDVLKNVSWPKPTLSSATEKVAPVTGNSGVKMTGPYDYVPPNYWFVDHRYGGAYGFNTETGPGPAIPPVESLEKMLPKEHLWPIDEFWDYHAGGENYKNIARFTHAIDMRYGKPTDLQDFEWKAQAAAYEGERAMFEAYGGSKYKSTGVIQWMLNNAWPSLIWHLYDYYLRPGAGYFGTKKACEPLHVQYSYSDDSVVVVNEYSQGFEQLKVTAKGYDPDVHEKFSHEQVLSVPADASVDVFGIPQVPDLPETYFLRLTLEDSSGKLISSNFYWLSRKPDVLNFKAYDNNVYTPESAYADFTALSKLPPVEPKFTSTFDNDGENGIARVQIENPTDHLAFLVRIKVTRGKNGEEILPVWWDDNYIALLPDEKREIRATYRLRDLEGASPSVEVDGWNVARKAN